MRYNFGSEDLLRLFRCTFELPKGQGWWRKWGRFQKTRRTGGLCSINSSILLEVVFEISLTMDLLLASGIVNTVPHNSWLDENVSSTGVTEYLNSGKSSSVVLGESCGVAAVWVIIGGDVLKGELLLIRSFLLEFYINFLQVCFYMLGKVRFILLQFKHHLGIKHLINEVSGVFWETPICSANRGSLCVFVSESWQKRRKIKLVYSPIHQRLNKQGL